MGIGRREWEPESNIATTTMFAQTCHVCRQPIEPGPVAHRTWCARYAHLECAAKNPKHWHEDVVGWCSICRAKHPLYELTADPSTAHLDPNLQTRRCAACLTAASEAAQ